MGDLGKLIAAKGFKKLPKSNKSPNLVTLMAKFTFNKTLLNRMNVFLIIIRTQYFNQMSGRDFFAKEFSNVLIVLWLDIGWGHSWQSGCFWHQRSTVRIQPSANFVNCQLYWKDEKDTRGREWANFCKTLLLSNRPIIYLPNSSFLLPIAATKCHCSAGWMLSILLTYLWPYYILWASNFGFKTWFNLYSVLGSRWHSHIIMRHFKSCFSGFTVLTTSLRSSSSSPCQNSTRWSTIG